MAVAAALTSGLAQTATFTTLHSFDGVSEGVIPNALVQGGDGVFYGTTTNGGSNNSGTVFAVTPAGALSVLHTFSALDSSKSNPDGAYPLAALVGGNDGNFYGSTEFGGSGGNGTIFRITPTGTFTILHSFSATTAAGVNNDGAELTGALILGGDGNFYGAASTGGAHGTGAIFQMTPDGVLSVLHSFDGMYVGQFGSKIGFALNQDGQGPSTLVQGSDGSFYGTTPVLGPNNTGTIFKIDAAGNFAVLYNFSATGTGANSGVNSDGSTPNSPLFEGADGNFYGTTLMGGPNGHGGGGGTIFRITPAGVFTTLHAFSALTDGANSDGAEPRCGLTPSGDGNFYGTTGNGGTYGNGTVYEVTPAGTVTTLYSFSALDSHGWNQDGALPYSRLLRGSDGYLYGTTIAGGKNSDGGGNGTAFEIVVAASGAAAQKASQPRSSAPGVTPP